MVFLTIKHKRNNHVVFLELVEVLLKTYIGEEYECPRGHRFCCSGPEKIIKISSTASVKVIRKFVLHVLCEVKGF